MDRTTDRTDAEPGPAELHVVWTIGPVRGADAEHILVVRRFHSAHRVVAALAGLQAGKVVSTLGRFLEYFRRNAEHCVNSPSPHFFRTLTRFGAGVLIIISFAQGCGAHRTTCCSGSLRAMGCGSVADALLVGQL